jgi:hypothetical protein
MIERIGAHREPSGNRSEEEKGTFVTAYRARGSQHEESMKVWKETEDRFAS